MNNKKIKVYTYTRVSTEMQTEGFSLEAQKESISNYAKAFNYEVVGEYIDAGKSGKAIKGRAEFIKMMEDIESNKDNVSFVLVYKLSRFGRNAADVLNSLQHMQDYNVNLICVSDGIDSSKDAGKLVITILSAVAEIERENISVQTMEGRIQKAKEGKWNGGFAPYGYKLVNGFLEIEENEAKDIRIIFEKYVNTDMGSNGISKYLQQQGIRKIPRQNGKQPYFSEPLIRNILNNPVYNGRIAFGRRKSVKIKGKRGETQVIKQDKYDVYNGVHKAIIDDETWEKAQVKRVSQAKKYEHVNKGKNIRTHLLSGLILCPICGAGLYGNRTTKKKDGIKYKEYNFYCCKHRRTLENEEKCDFKKQLKEEKLDDAVAEIITKLVSNPKFAKTMQNRINIKTNTNEIDKEIAVYRKEVQRATATKRSIELQLDTLDYDDKHYDRKQVDLNIRLDKIYDKISDIDQLLAECIARKKAVDEEQLTNENIYKILINFEKLYEIMNREDKRKLLITMIKEINIHEEAKQNGQWLKSIKFKLPIIEKDIDISLDNNNHVECVVLLQKVES